jgi:hypothetical protein
MTQGGVSFNPRRSVSQTFSSGFGAAFAKSSIRKEKLLTFDFVGSNGALTFRRNEPIDEGLA